MRDYSGLPCGIISLDGGGIRGLYQAQFLSQFQETPLFDNICVIAGTSTGAIIAALISIGVKPGAIVELYLRLGADVFGGGRSLDNWLAEGAFYSQKKLKKHLEKVCQGRKLRDCLYQTLIVASVVDDASFKIFDSQDKDDAKISLVDVLLASTAAPMFFRPHFIKETGATYFDGGLACNNPAMQAVIAAKQNNVQIEDIYLLSIGTAGYPEICIPIDLTKANELNLKVCALLKKKGREALKKEAEHLLAQAVRVFDTSLCAGSELVHKNCEDLLSKENYIRINHVVPGEVIALDDFRIAAGKLPRLAIDDARANRGRIDGWVKELAKRSGANPA